MNGLLRLPRLPMDPSWRTFVEKLSFSEVKYCTSTARVVKIHM